MSGISLAELIRRPELSYADVAPIDKNRPELAWDVQEQVNINIKYDGYIRRQMKQVEQFKKLEAKKIPEDLDYTEVFDDLLEAYTRRYELTEVKTTNMGSLFKLTYQLSLKDTSKEKEMIDHLRCRNGNLEIMVKNQETTTTSL